MPDMLISLLAAAFRPLTWLDYVKMAIPPILLFAAGMVAGGSLVWWLK